MSSTHDEEAEHPLSQSLSSPETHMALFSPRTVRSLGTNLKSTLRGEVQRAHFSAFFVAHHDLRHPLPAEADLISTMRLLADGLSKMSHSAPWFRLQLHLKVRRTLRKRAQRQALAAAQRTETLDGCLAYWTAAEGKIQQTFRQQLQSPVTLQEVLRGHRNTVARAITPVTDSLKVQVIWELYWILRAQYTFRMKLYWQRLLALIAQRKAVLRERAAGLDLASGVDFWQGEPRSLRAIDATIFVLMLQEPKFQFIVGRDVKVTELLRLANANLAEGSWVEVADSPLGPQGCPTLLAFLRSPLLTEPQWLKGRSRQTSNLIPPRTWNPIGRQPPPATARSGRASAKHLLECRRDSPAGFGPTLARLRPLLDSPNSAGSRSNDGEGEVAAARVGRRERRRSSAISGSPLTPTSGMDACALAADAELAFARPMSGDQPLNHSASGPLLLTATGLSPGVHGRRGSGPLWRPANSPGPTRYEHLFRKERAEMTAIYPKLPAPLPPPPQESTSPNRLPGASSAVPEPPRRASVKCSLPTIPPRRC